MASLQGSATRAMTGRQTAYNAAYAGMQHARQVLASLGTDWGGITLSNNARATALDDRPQFGNLHRGSCVARGVILHEGANPLLNVPYPSSTLSTNPLGRYTIWIRNDTAELKKAVNDGATIADTNGAVVVRVQGEDPRGEYQVVVETALTRGSVGNTVNLDYFTFGKGLNPYGSNDVTGAVNF
jgi:hypothetical protein